MILSHFSKEPLTLDPSYQYPVNGNGPFKPGGLWLSNEADYGWSQWCNDVEHALSGLVHETRFTIRPEAKVLTINSDDELATFSLQYGKKEYGLDSIDWAKVRDEYDGILIPYYLHRSRFVMWYYGWDCASGCIWNLDAIEVERETQLR